MSEALIIPIERLLACSFDINDRIEALQAQGVDFRADAALLAARQSIRQHVPDLAKLSNEAAEVEATDIFQWHDGEAHAFPSGGFTAELGRVSLEQIHRTEFVDLIGEEIDVVNYDLTLVFRQKVINPDPVDLGYSDEIMVPLRSIETLKLSS